MTQASLIAPGRPDQERDRLIQRQSYGRRIMRRRDFLKTAGGWACAGALPTTGKPNIVFIAADDLGYGELSVQGSKDVSTPHIDSIAANGVRFTDGYVSCPVCSPTRAGWMTGRYQQRFGHEFNPGPADQADENFGLPLSETTMADRLKAAGYAGGWELFNCCSGSPYDEGTERSMDKPLPRVQCHIITDAFRQLLM